MTDHAAQARALLERARLDRTGIAPGTLTEAATAHALLAVVDQLAERLQLAQTLVDVQGDLAVLRHELRGRDSWTEQPRPRPTADEQPNGSGNQPTDIGHCARCGKPDRAIPVDNRELDVCSDCWAAVTQEAAAEQQQHDQQADQ